MVKSPVTGNPAKLVLTLPVERVVDEYLKLYNINVRHYFENIDSIELYQCPDTGYRFFHPFSMAGNEELYEALQKFSWYYPGWKWEYDKATDYIPRGSKVLEVGCGEGKYLKYLEEKHDCKGVGLELNLQAVNAAKANGLDVRHELVQQHATTHAGAYDVVYFFQVLEHIADIRSFIEASVACLKPGGKLLICVPNNEPYMFNTIKHYSLNIAPHHMGWWNTASLTAIAPYFGLKTDKVFYDVIGVKYIPAVVNIYIRENSYGNEIKRGIMQLAKPFLWAKFYLERKNIPDAHIMGVYTKL